MQQLRQTFLTPPAEFTPIPFWFWNGDLTEAEIQRQMEDFRDKGIMGFVIHPRIGIPRRIGYLSARFMALVRYAVALAADMGMRVVLYDEGMYPSGSACGQVVAENAAYASRGITLLEGDAPALPPSARIVARVALRKTGAEAYDPGSARLLAEGELPAPGETAVCILEDFTHGTIRGIHEGQDDGQPDAPPSADLLNPDAMRCFIRLTHERYYEALAPHFGKTVIAMFTDEPNPVGRGAWRGVRAWTAGLEAEWRQRGLPLEALPALWWNARGEEEAIRTAHERLIADRMVETYYGPLSAWCEAHGIALAGHPAEADSIGLERLFGIPGQDVVWRFVAPEGRLGLEGRESTQAKCASDSARHWGKRRNSNECFGCCGPQGKQWAFTVGDMKWYMDWLFVRGTNLLYPHAFFYAVDTPLRWGERPPDVGPNSYWWPHQARISMYMRRMCAMLTDGVNQARVAILTSEVALPWRLPALLFERQVEFNYLEEDLLPLAALSEGRLQVRAQRYDVIAVEDTALLTPENAAHLDRFARGGVRVLVLGQPGAETLEAMAGALADAGLGDVALEPPCADIRATHLRHEGAHLFLLTNEGEHAWEGRLTLSARGACERWDAWTGDISPAGSGRDIPLRLERRGSVLLAVNPDAAPLPPPEAPGQARTPLSVAIAWRAICPDGTRLALDALGDWQQWAGMALHSGTVAYEGTFTLDAVPRGATLDLGDVREMAVVSVNGHAQQALLLSPFTLEVGGMLRAGENSLRVEVTSGRLSFFEREPWPAGLLGPVRILMEG